MKIAILGAGMSGLAAALELSKIDCFEISIFDSGNEFEGRESCDLNGFSQNIMGVGGAGTLGGGKLCLPPASGYIWQKTLLNPSKWDQFSKICPDLLGNIDIGKINLSDSYVTTSRSSDLVRKEYRTILLMKDEMAAFIKRLLRQLKKRKNVFLHTNHSVQSIEKRANKFNIYFAGSSINNRNTDVVIIATGRSSAPYIGSMLERLKLVLSPSSPDMGARILTDLENAGIFVGCGEDKKIKIIDDNCTIRTFCVCNGGTTSRVNVNNVVYYDGDYGARNSGILNFGIMFRARHFKGVMSSLEYCNAFDGNSGVAIDLKKFLMRPYSVIKHGYYIRYGIVLDGIRHFILSLNKHKHFSDNLDKTQILFPSIDHYNPIIRTNRGFESSEDDLFVIGDATGISRGYVQALWSGWVAAKYIIEKNNILTN